MNAPQIIGSQGFSKPASLMGRFPAGLLCGSGDNFLVPIEIIRKIFG